MLTERGNPRVPRRGRPSLSAGCRTRMLGRCEKKTFSGGKGRFITAVRQPFPVVLVLMVLGRTRLRDIVVVTLGQVQIMGYALPERADARYLP